MLIQKRVVRTKFDIYVLLTSERSSPSFYSIKASTFSNKNSVVHRTFAALRGIFSELTDSDWKWQIQSIGLASSNNEQIISQIRAVSRWNIKDHLRKSLLLLLRIPADDLQTKNLEWSSHFPY